VPDSRKDRSLSHAIAAETVGDEAARLVFQTLQQMPEERLGGCATPSVLHEDVEHHAMLIHRAPQIMQHTSNADEHLVQVPCVARLRSATALSAGEVSTKLQAPVPDAFVGYHDPTFRQDQLNITQAEAEDVVQPDGVADDLARKPVPRIRGGFERHPVSLADLPTKRQTPLTCQCRQRGIVAVTNSGRIQSRNETNDGLGSMLGASRTFPGPQRRYAIW
jgi:hypothetical protein